MVATFLQHELESSRFGTTLRELLKREHVSLSVVAMPEVTDLVANEQRRDILRLHRGYGSTGDDAYLSGFPTIDVSWEWWALAPAEILTVRYIDWDYWLELSDHTRLPTRAAARIAAGICIHGVNNDGFLAGADTLRSGGSFPPLILVSAGRGERIVALEGHSRLTAYALAPESLPPALPVLLGTSSVIASWSCY